MYVLVLNYLLSKLHISEKSYDYIQGNHLFIGLNIKLYTELVLFRYISYFSKISHLVKEYDQINLKIKEYVLHLALLKAIL